MTEDQKEIVKLMKEWKNDIKNLTTDYKDNIAKLDNARVEFKKPNILEWIYRFSGYILIIILFLISLWWLTYQACGGMIKIGDNQMTIPCRNNELIKK